MRMRKMIAAGCAALALCAAGAAYCVLYGAYCISEGNGSSGASAMALGLLAAFSAVLLAIIA